MTEWLSRLIQPRGLKSSDFVINTDASSRGLYSLVDWNDKFPTMRTRDKMSRLIQPRGLKSCSADGFRFGGRSRLIQPRGLKFNWKWAEYRFKCRGLYSLVDWNIIEKQKGKRNKRRGLYSLVDWNHHYPSSCVWPSWVEAYTASWIEIAKPIIVMKEFCVEAYTASWIEIMISTLHTDTLPSSRLIQPRGLK